MVVMKFENGKVAHEHIYWDQASLLVQVGLLDPANLPVAGVEQARELIALPRNTAATSKPTPEEANEHRYAGNRLGHRFRLPPHSEGIENPYSIWDALRSKCPGARSATVPLVLEAVE